MEQRGVSSYLLLVDAESLEVLWANDMVEAVVAARSGASAVGLPIDAVIPMASGIDLPARLRAVAATGEPDYLNTMGISIDGRSTRTDASLYRLPSGQLLVASQYTVGAGVPGSGQ